MEEDIQEVTPPTSQELAAALTHNHLQMLEAQVQEAYAVFRRMQITLQGAQMRQAADIVRLRKELEG